MTAGLIPICLSSAGIMKAVIAVEFWNGTSFLFCVGFLMGIVLEHWNLQTYVDEYGFTGESAPFASFHDDACSVPAFDVDIQYDTTILCMLPVVKSFLHSTEKHRPFKGNAFAMGWSATVA